MRIATNTGSDRVIDVLAPHLASGASISIASPEFSLFAYAELRRRLGTVSACRLILPVPDGHALNLLGSEYDRPARNRLQLRWLARSCAQWLAKEVELRIVPKPLPQAMIVVNGEANGCALVGRCALSGEGLGLRNA